MRDDPLSRFPPGAVVRVTLLDLDDHCTVALQETHPTGIGAILTLTPSLSPIL